MLGDTSAHQSEPPPAESAAASVGAPSGDSLLDLFGSSQPAAAQPVVNQPAPTAPVVSQIQDGSAGGLMDLLGGDLLMTHPIAGKYVVYGGGDEYFYYFCISTNLLCLAVTSDGQNSCYVIGKNELAPNVF